VPIITLEGGVWSLEEPTYIAQKARTSLKRYFKISNFPWVYLLITKSHNEMTKTLMDVS
jgi:hypothetical protein